MAVITIKPNGDVTTNWETIVPSSPTTHFDKIDEGTATPNDADYVETEVVDEWENYDYEDVPTNLDLVSQIKINLRGFIDDADSNARYQIDLFHSGGTLVDGCPVYIDGADLGGYGTTPGTAFKTLTGLSLTQAQANTLQSRVYTRQT
jgi:hypothetical protein